MDFNIGDIITGNFDNPYNYTDRHATMQVVEFPDRDDDADIKVQIISHENNTDVIGHRYDVDSQYFTLVRRAKDVSDEDIASDEDMDFLFG